MTEEVGALKQSCFVRYQLRSSLATKHGEFALRLIPESKLEASVLATEAYAYAGILL